MHGNAAGGAGNLVDAADDFIARLKRLLKAGFPENQKLFGKGGGGNQENYAKHVAKDGRCFSKDTVRKGYSYSRV